jgi:type I restriction enzyme S subunit
MDSELHLGTIRARGFDWSRVRFPGRRIGEVVTLNYGKSLPEPTRRAGTVKIYGTNGPCGFHDTSLADGPGVILGRKGEGHLGVKWCQSPFWVIDTAYFASVNQNEVDMRWFYYVTSFVGLDHLKTGEKPGLSRDTFGRQIFPFPLKDEQRAITEVLGALDDKIEVGLQMNRTLEELTAALFRSWFIEFDPVVANAAGRKPAHLCTDVAALFPTSFKDSRLGPIPNEWDVGKVDDIATLVRNSVNPRDFPTETFDHYSIPAFDDGQRAKQESGASIKSNKFLVPPGCVMISKLNPDTPRVWLPDVVSERRAVCSTEFFVTVPKAPASREFVFSIYSSDAFASSFASLVTGTSNSHQRVQPEGLHGLEIVIPDGRVMSEFTKLVRPWLAQITQNRRELETLSVLRDRLLPKLLSGELRVKQAEKFVATAG